MSCGLGCRCGLDPALLWLWYRVVGEGAVGLKEVLGEFPSCGGFCLFVACSRFHPGWSSTPMASWICFSWSLTLFVVHSALSPES